MRQSFLFLAGCYGLAGCLWAGPIYNYTATSASTLMRSWGVFPDRTIAYENDTLASAPGFSLNVGGSGGDTLNRFFVGDQIPLNMFLFIEGGYALVDFGGITQQVSILEGLDGSAQVTANESSFVLPPNPNPSYTFAARMTGQFTARPYEHCGSDLPPPAPPCDASAVLSINLPGTLTVSFTHFPNPAAPYELTETFASVPEPSSLGLWLLGAGISGTVWLARRNKTGRSSC